MQMSHYKQFAQKIGLIGFTNLFYGLQGLILLPILTKNLPIEDYGTWVLITVTIGLIPSLVMLGLPYTMVRYLAVIKTKREIQEGFYSIVIITIIPAGTVFLFLFLLAEPIATALFANRVDVTRLLAILIFLECMNQLQYNYFRTFQQVKKYSALFLSRVCLQVLLASAFVLTGYGIFGAVMGYFIASLLMLIMMGFLIISEIGIAIPKFINFKEYISFGLPTVPGNLSSWTVRLSDRYMIGLLLGMTYVGYYSPGYELGTVISIFIAPLSFMLPAVLSKHYDENSITEVQKILQYSLKYYLLLAIPSVIGLSLLSESILMILSTPEIAKESYIITPFVALATLLFGVYAIVMQVLILDKNTKITGIIWVVAAIINVGLNIIIIPYLGIITAALTTLIAFAFALIATLPYTRKYFTGFSWNMKKEIPYIIFASLLMIPVIVLFHPTGIVPILLVIGLSIFVYFGAILILKCITTKEIIFFKNFIY